MNRYVVGYAFEGERCLLVKKSKPEWQKGLLNGVGGKIDENEAPISAMVREFKEETTIDTRLMDWKNYCTIKNDFFEIFYFRIDLNLGVIDGAVNPEDKGEELIIIESNSNLFRYRLVPNVSWTMLMAKDSTVDSSMVNILNF